MREIDATIFTIATGKYLAYFALQLEQIEKHYAPGKNLQVIVATDQLEKLPASKDPRVKLEYVTSPSYSWPEITLLRYEQILANKDRILGETLMWLDTDMALLQDIPFELIRGNGLTPNLAKQPGFVWAGRKADWTNPWKLGLQLLPWVRAWLRLQPTAGTWETRKLSNAYVPRMKRRTYVHGAVWGGGTSQVLKMVEVLASRTREDYEKNVVALWHDESHLNWFAANQPVQLYPDQFSAWRNAWQFDEPSAYLESLDKAAMDSMIKSKTVEK